MDAQSSARFSNGAPIHAAIIFDVFFRKATRYVKIFCRNLSSKVFDASWIVESAEQALSRGVAIYVVSQTVAEDSVFKTWLESKSDKVTFIQNASESKPIANMLSCNFAVMDGIAYRYEGNAQEINAVACMNDRSVSAKLDDLFFKVSA